MRFLFILFFIIAFSITNIAFAQSAQTPEELRAEAFTKVKIGTELMRKASDLLSRGVEESSIKAGISLYAQAGKLFQDAYNVLNYLGEDYVSATDLKGTSQAMQSCMQAINGLKEAMIQKQ